MWNRVTIVGCGLIGASFALALRRSGLCGRLAGWDSSAKVIDDALSRGIIDEVDRSAVTGTPSSADLVYLAMPVAEIINFFRENGKRMKHGAVLTDAGSTKTEVCRAARFYLPKKVRFVGGHPITGSHHSGLANASADLFAGAPYVLTLERPAINREAKNLARTLESIGARVTFMTAVEHDQALALLSHLPQVLSSALAATIEERANTEAPLVLAGPGYRDMTRLAGSAWSMWHDILATNPLPIARALSAMIDRLTFVRNELLEHAERPLALPVSKQLFNRSQQQTRTTYGSDRHHDSHPQT